MRPVLGVDGCPGGWIAALVGDAQLSWYLLADASAVLALGDNAGVAAIAIDIPMGLSDDGPRACDRAARAALGQRGASVFPAPVRTVLTASSYADACALSRAARGVAVSRQSWFITAKVAQWDAVLTPARQRQVVETHPELGFATLTGTTLPPKRTPAGRVARLAALAGWLPQLPGALAARPRPARTDDALDAVICAWTAYRWAVGDAVVLPANPPVDARGLAMRIVC